MRRLLALAALLLSAAPARATSFSLTIATTGPVAYGAVITSTPSGIVCPGTCTAYFSSTTAVTIGEVNPSTVAFVGWTGSPTTPPNCNNNLPTCGLTVTVASTVTAHFNPLLALSAHGSGVGAVTGNLNVYLSSAVYANDVVQLFVATQGAHIVLTASTGTASAFTGWTGDAGCGTASTCTITLNGYEAITATFTASGSTFPLAAVVPLGGGFVVSSPTGISCGAGICTSTFTANTSVSFTTSASAGYYFSGWSGAGCHGNIPCVVVSTSPLQGLGGPWSPAAYFYPIPGGAP